MRFNKIVLSGLTLLASLGTASLATANGRNPGSLLLYPEFDNTVSDLTLLTVTNTNTGVNLDGSNGTVAVEFVYIGKYNLQHQVINCLESNRTEILTANDTLSVITRLHNPNQEQGFVYVFAKDPITGHAKVFNFLIGNLMTLESITSLEYSMNPVSFKGIGNASGDTDIHPTDGLRQLDGVEYEAVADQILIPRFIGWDGSAYHSELILIGLTGGAQFTTVVDFLVYNDNEEVFSAQYSFKCWARVPLGTLNGVFTQVFLKSTNNAPNEILGANQTEAGWMKLNGNTAFSTQAQFNDPAIYAVLIEKIGAYGAADLPFETPQLNATPGALFSHTLLGT
jgi:hypothetical protein